jgi:DNA-binding transcriptional MerR regulator
VRDDPISKPMANPVSKVKRPAAGTKRASARSTAPKARAESSSARARSASKGAPAATAAEGDLSLDLDEILPDGKLYYRIGEVSKITGVKAYVLRYWESEFRWMAPQKSRSKQRLYRRKDIETILLIRKLLYQERYTIAGARQRLRELGAGKSTAAGKSRESSASAAPASAQEGKSRSHAAKPGGSVAPASGDDAETRSRFRQIREELLAIRESL